MDMSKLKSTHYSEDINDLIERGSLYGGGLWQGKLISKIVEIQSDLDTGHFTLRMSADTFVDSAVPLYIRLNYRSTLFRLRPGEFKKSGEHITFCAPREIYSLEERKGGNRYVLPLTAEISLSLKRFERTYREIIHEIELRIMDVSENGFGIVISSYNRDYLKAADNFWIKSIDHNNLSNPLVGTVCYVAPKLAYLKHGDVRVGLSLANPLTQEMLAYLKRRSLFVLSS